MDLYFNVVLKREKEMFSERFKVTEMEQFHMSGATGMNTREQRLTAVGADGIRISLALKSQKIQSKKKQFQGTLNTRLKGF